jgi:tripartite-type tricarboxylate transporter receptor subunit TctC
METPAVRDKLLAEGAAPESSTPEELRLFIREEIAKWANAVKLAGAKID